MTVSNFNYTLMENNSQMQSQKSFLSPIITSTII